MKENKILVLACLGAIFALYFITYSFSDNSSTFNNLTLDEKLFFFNELDDDQKEGIANTSIDSLKKEFFEDSLTYNKIKSLPFQTYEAFQKISLESLSIEQNLHIYRRLILILCLVLYSYFLFSKKYNFNITFQKAMFHNAVFSFIFSLFCIFSFILTQTIRGTVGDSSFLLQYGFAHFISVLKSTLFWFVAISFFIYFHPQNIDWYQKRVAKKKRKEGKS
tara:strand:- start:3003 stop:3665 length:663 start_codon:yes stop_codon:yes gene_type:complete